MRNLVSSFLLILLVSCGQKTTTTTTTDLDTSAIVTQADEPLPSGEQPDGSVPDDPLPTTGSSGPTGGTTPGGTPAGSNEGQYATGNIRVSSPRANDYVNAERFQLSGTARTFENNVAYRLTDLASKKVIAQGFTTATGEMGTFSPYETTVQVNQVSGVQYPTRALLEVYENSAKDGTEINKVQIPVRVGVGADEPNAVEVYFLNGRKGSNNDCSKVFSLPRSIPQTKALATVTMQKLLAGPTAAESAQGFSTQIPAGTTLNSVRVANGTATVDLSNQLSTAAGACRVTAIRSQIERTLRQFSTVQRVAITVNGKSDGVLEP